MMSALDPRSHACGHMLEVYEDDEDAVTVFWVESYEVTPPTPPGWIAHFTMYPSGGGPPFGGGRTSESDGIVRLMGVNINDGHPHYFGRLHTSWTDCGVQCAPPPPAADCPHPAAIDYTAHFAAVTDGLASVTEAVTAGLAAADGRHDAMLGHASSLSASALNITALMLLFFAIDAVRRSFRRIAPKER